MRGSHCGPYVPLPCWNCPWKKSQTRGIAYLGASSVREIYLTKSGAHNSSYTSNEISLLHCLVKHRAFFFFQPPRDDTNTSRHCYLKTLFLVYFFTWRVSVDPRRTPPRQQLRTLKAPPTRIYWSTQPCPDNPPGKNVSPIRPARSLFHVFCPRGSCASLFAGRRRGNTSCQRSANVFV